MEQQPVPPPPQTYYQPEMSGYSQNSAGNSNDLGRQSPYSYQNINNDTPLAAPSPYHQQSQNNSAISSRTSLDSNDQLFDDHRQSQNYGSADPENFLDIDDQKPKKGWLRNRRKGCCFICCGVLLIITAVMIPTGIFVIAPAIAQGAVTGSQISFSSANLTNLTEDNFVMTVQGKVTDTGPMAAVIDVPDGVQVSWNGTVLGLLPLDEISAAPFVGANIDSTQTFNITNKTAFGEFNKFMLSSKEFTWHIEGTANVRAAGLSLKGIKLSKDITMAGMENFPDVTIESFDAPSDDPAGGITIRILSNLGNPSPIGVELGDLDFEVQYNSQTVGYVSATGVTLAQGTNRLDLNGRLIPQNSSDGLNAVSEMFSNYIAGKDSNTSVIAREVRPGPNSAPISWLQSAFVGTELSVVLHGGQNLSVINSVNIEDMDLSFSSNNPYSPIASSDSISVSFKIPFGFQLSMKKIAQNITIYDGSTALATLSTQYTDATGNSSVGVIDSSIPATPFEVVKGSENAFNDFSEHLTTDSSVSMTMKGTANSIATTSIGDVEITGIGFTVDTSLQGLQGLKAKPIVINSLSVTGGTSDHMIIQLSVTLFNPSNVQISMGDVAFDFYYQSAQLGQVLMNNLTLDRGTNTVNVITNFGPNGDQAISVGRNLLDSFMKGASNSVSIQGNMQSTPILSLQKAISSLQMSTTMPGLQTDRPILTKTLFAINPLTVLFTNKGTAALDAYNPLDTTLQFLHINASIEYQGQVIAVVDQDLSSSPIVIPAKQDVTSRDMDLTLKISGAAIQSLLAGLAGTLQCNVASTILLKVGDYQTTLDYSQDNVPTSLGHGNNN